MPEMRTIGINDLHTTGLWSSKEVIASWRSPGLLITSGVMNLSCELLVTQPFPNKGFEAVGTKPFLPVSSAEPPNHFVAMSQSARVIVHRASVVMT